ncbi:MAG: 6-phosphogluconolactonase [Oscillospiraceae bacterium]|nr:6-phosphogluconolactonase [Oscillospiraceae bacterium]
MKIVVSRDPESLGAAAAEYAARRICEAIDAKGEARIVLSTGASQFTTLAALVKKDVDWARVTMFHLDEYVALPDTHPASFRKYLRERFINVVHPGKAYLVDGTPEGIPALTAALREAPIDLGLIGIGENGHIAFNDPPADLDTREAYIVVDLNDTCKRQQVGEGWFPDPDSVPRQAISMTVWQILQCRHILSAVPFPVKAEAVRKTLEQDANALVPATVMKGHESFALYVDRDSFSLVDESRIRPAPGVPWTLEKAL